MFWGMVLTNLPELFGFIAVAGVAIYFGKRWGHSAERKRLIKLNPGLSIT